MMRTLLLRLLRLAGLSGPLRSLYHRLFFHNRRVEVSCAGISRTFVTPTPTIAEHALSLTGEGPVLEELLRALQPGDVFWDVGGGFGLYALFAAARLTESTVVSFEPEAGVRALLERNIETNGAQNVIILPLALGNTNGEGGLHASVSPNAGASSMVRRTDYRVRRRAASVRTVRGDTLIRSGEAPAPTAVKIDVEGAEQMVLAGLEDTLRSGHVRLLCCEVHPLLLPLFGASAAGVEEMIASWGFIVKRRHARGTESLLYCTRKG